MEIVVDASALLAVVMGEPERANIIEATEKVSLMAPAALPLEIGNALIAMSKRGRIEEPGVARIWEASQAIPVRLIPVDIGRSLEIALQRGTYAYDAYYLECAQSSRRPLLTLDRRMRDAAESLGLRLWI